MIYVKSILIATAMFVLTFALAVMLMLLHSAPPLPSLPADAANAEVAFDVNSNWVDMPLWPPLLAGIVAFAGGFYWMFRRSRRRGARQ